MLLKNSIFAAIVLLGAIYLASEVLPGSRGFPSAKPANDLDVIQGVAGEVDSEFRSKWNASNLETAGKAADLIIARRLSLGLTGTIPSLEEIRKFEAVDAEHRIDWWTNYLLTDERYSDYVAERLSRAFVGVEDGPFIVYRRRRFVMWLSEQLKANRPYNELVKELISENGLWTDTPSVNFYTVTIDNQNANRIRFDLLLEPPGHFWVCELTASSAMTTHLAPWSWALKEIHEEVRKRTFTSWPQRSSLYVKLLPDCKTPRSRKHTITSS